MYFDHGVPVILQMDCDQMQAGPNRSGATGAGIHETQGMMIGSSTFHIFSFHNITHTIHGTGILATFLVDV